MSSKLKAHCSKITFYFYTVAILLASTCPALSQNESSLSLKDRAKLGEKLYDEKKYSEAISVLKVDIENQPSNVQLILARSFNRTKESLNELRVLNLITSKDEKDFLANTQLGYYYLTQKRSQANIDNMISAFRKALENNNKFLPAYEGLIQYFKEKDDANNNYQLRNLYSDMIQVFGRKSIYINELCRLNAEGGYQEAAKNFCSEAIRLDPKNANNHVALGRCLITQSEFDQADKVLAKAAESFPGSVDAQLAYAQFLEQQKNLIKAEAFYKKASLIDEKSFLAISGLGRMMADLKKYEEAIPVFQKACDLDPKQSLTILKKVTTSIRLDDKMDIDQKYAQGLSRCLPSGQ